MCGHQRHQSTGADTCTGDSAQKHSATGEAVADDESLLGHLLLVAGKMASKLGVDDAFRLVINNGADAGQTVFLCICTFLLTNRFQRVAWATSLGSLIAAECPIR